MTSWIECVPNFSEGRDRAVIDRIREAILSVQNVALLDATWDHDHHRSVFTLAGPPDDVAEAVLRAAAVAIEAIDLRRHQGAHPRIGALDVVPFVPLDEASRETCVDLAHRVGEQLWNRFRVPVYFYGDAARSGRPRRLEQIRRGGFEGLRENLPRDKDRLPDIGGPELHPSAGATAVGVRKILIAYNIDLETRDVAVAKEIARAIRESSGGLPFVKALGLELPSRGCTQVSMNLTDFEQTPLHLVFEKVRQEAERRGSRVAGSEIIGLIPRKALEMAAAHFLQIKGFRPEMILEGRLAEKLAPKAGRAKNPA